MRRPLALALTAVLTMTAVVVPAQAVTGPSGTGPEGWSSARLAARLTFTCVDADDAAAMRRHASYGVGGITLLGSPRSAPRLRAAISAARGAAAYGMAPVIASDEEGGRVQRLGRVIGPLPPARTMGTWTTAKVAAVAEDYGSKMRSLGVGVDFAPVADLGVPGAYLDRSRRAFGRDAAQVSPDVLAFSAGLRAAGVTPVVKHWPGHGSATNTHTGAARVAPLASLRARDLKPFEAVFEQARRTPAQRPVVVMVGHLESAGLTERGTPASASPNALAVLRRSAGPDAVIITDSLSMAAASSARRMSPEAAAVASLRAGADWALTCAGDPRPTIRAVRAALDDGRYPRARAAASVRRLLAVPRG